MQTPTTILKESLRVLWRKNDIPANAPNDPAQVVANRMELQKIRSALARLTPEQRQVISLKYLENWGIEEIAQAMNKPVGAVKSLQHRAINTLRRLIK